MRIIAGYITILMLLGLGRWLSTRPPAWLSEDPLTHPFGRELQASEQSRASRGGNSDAADSVAVEFPIDLGRATRRELMALPRIGPATAERILAHRDTLEGPFGLPELEAVRGIGPKTIARLRPLVVAEVDSNLRP